VQSHLGGQADLKAVQGVGAFAFNHKQHKQGQVLSRAISVSLMILLILE
jgi:hypothetical protein